MGLQEAGAKGRQEMTQKLYRDSKGRFVNRKELVEELRGMIRISNHAGMNRIYQTFPPQIIRASRKCLASYIRQFRNKHKIYECF